MSEPRPGGTYRFAEHSGVSVPDYPVVRYQGSDTDGLHVFRTDVSTIRLSWLPPLVPVP